METEKEDNKEVAEIQSNNPKDNEDKEKKIDYERLNKILAMVPNRYTANSVPPYIVYFTRINVQEMNSCSLGYLLNCLVPRLLKPDIIIVSQPGKAVVYFLNYNAANDIIEFNIKELRQLGWFAYIPTFKISRTVIVNNIDINLKIQDVKEYLQTSKELPDIISIERMKKKDLTVKKCGVLKFVPTDSIKIMFKGTQIPSSIRIGNKDCKVEPFIPKVRQCKNCQKFGHNANECNRRPRCERCSDYHTHTECSAEELKCVNCEGRHKASDLQCPKYFEQIRVKKIMATQNIPFQEAFKIYKERSGISIATKETVNCSTLEEYHQLLEKYAQNNATVGTCIPSTVVRREIAFCSNMLYHL